MTDLNKLTASEAAKRIARREISAEALVRDCLERISERDKAVQAWQFVDPEIALAQARALDKELAGGRLRGPLHGIPLGVKDIFDTFDMPAEYGSPIYQGNRPASDAGTVVGARRAGMVILGKTVTCELATHVPSKTHNPHNLEHTPGGSSSGSAAAVADLMTPLAIGTQTVGSTIRPASYCGIVGYKPTFNLLSRAGCKTEADSLDTVGVMARSVPDVALYAGAQANDARLLELPAIGRKLKIGLCRTFDTDLIEPATGQALERAASELARAGAKVTEFSLPESFRPLREAHGTVCRFEMGRSYAYEYDHYPDKIFHTLRERIAEGARTSGEQYARAQSIGHRCRAQFADAMGDLDALLAPSAPGEAPKNLGTTGSPLLNAIWTFLWTPTVTVPAYKGPSGMPVGVQVCGRMHDDARTLAAAQWIHQQLAM